MYSHGEKGDEGFFWEDEVEGCFLSLGSRVGELACYVGRGVTVVNGRVDVHQVHLGVQSRLKWEIYLFTILFI